MTQDQTLPDFFQLLQEAGEALDAVDNYDLDSSNADSVKQWNELQEQHRTTLNALVEYCKTNTELLPRIALLTQSIKPMEGYGG